ncbi:MAG: hypothetical protein HOQ24_03335, partial [Mycobacteriaceae bacterium]|nr:hypothetical protein [Mycobacteriaceae bacterium]
GAPILSWAVSASVSPQSPSDQVDLLVTSNEGRGWLPAGLYLPSRAATPWGRHPDEHGWEGLADPARILVAYARASDARLSVLVSSAPLDPELQHQCAGVACEGLVAPAPESDLGSRHPGLLDRLAFAAPPEAGESAMSVPDSDVAVQCLTLAWRGHLRANQAGAGHSVEASLALLRFRILTALRREREVPPPWWEDLSAADDRLAQELAHSRAAGSGRVERAVVRALTAQRRADELVLLLRGERTRQDLRDAVYAHFQLG